MGPRSSRLERIAPFVAFLWPFVFYSNFLIPWIDGSYRALENDFYVLYYNYKLYLLASLASGHFHLWSPSEAAGYPFYSSPFAQALYPFNVPLLGFYELFNRYPPLIHQWFTIFGVGIFCAGMYMWLKTLTRHASSALASAVVFSVCLKIGDILRFPNAVHTAAWIPWILFLTHGLFFGARRKVHTLALCVVLVCFLTGGYPYYVYYSLFLFIPYAVAILIPRIRRWLFPRETDAHVLSGLWACAGAGAAALVIAGPYLYKMSLLLASTVDRTGEDFTYSVGYPFHPLHSLGSLIFPPVAQTDGTYFFGLAALFLMVLEITRRPRPAHLLLLAWFGTLTYITWGEQSVLFKALWHVLPGFSHLRVWGRMNILLVLLLAWLFALCLDSFRAEARDWAESRWSVRTVAMFSGVALTVLATQLYLYVYQPRDAYWTDFVKPIVPFWFAEAHSLVFGWMSFGLLLGALCFMSLRMRWPVTRAVIVAVIALSVLDVSVVGRKQWSSRQQMHLSALRGLWNGGRLHESASTPIPSPRVSPRTAEPEAALRIEVPAQTSIDLKSFSVARSDSYGTISETAEFSVGTVPNWYFDRYVKFRVRTNSEDDARAQLLGVRDGRKLYCSDRISYTRIADFLEDSHHCQGSVKVLAYNGDILLLDVRLDRAGFLSFIDNWDPDWKAYLDGAEVPIELLMGTFKSARVPEGAHHLEFRYRPFALNGP